MSIVGLDLSLTATGVANEHGTRTLSSRQKGMLRLVELRAGVLDACEHASLAVIEGYGFASTRIAAQAELGGIVRMALWEHGITIVDVAPAALKKYATGVGNAPKERVFAAAIRRLGYEGNSHDEADALWLRTMGRDALGFIASPVPANHREALNKITWPIGDREANA